MNDLKNKYFFLFHKYQLLLRSFSIIFILRSGVIAINLGTGILLRNELGEANSGQFGLFIGALILFNTFLNLGFNGSAIYYAKKKPEKAIIKARFLFRSTIEVEMINADTNPRPPTTPPVLIQNCSL